MHPGSNLSFDHKDRVCRFQNRRSWPSRPQRLLPASNWDHPMRPRAARSWPTVIGIEEPHTICVDFSAKSGNLNDIIPNRSKEQSQCRTPFRQPIPALPTINRRSAFAKLGLGLAASTNVAATAIAAPDAGVSPELMRLIEAHRAAFAARQRGWALVRRGGASLRRYSAGAALQGHIRAAARTIRGMSIFLWKSHSG